MQTVTDKLIFACVPKNQQITYYQQQASYHKRVRLLSSNSPLLRHAGHQCLNLRFDRLTGIYLIYQGSHDCHLDDYVITALVPDSSTVFYLN
jgi:hypothetical protein